MSETRTCISCRHELPLDRFYASGHGTGRRRTCKRCLSEEGRRERRRAGAKIRHTRYNARGWVWCNRCQHYKPTEDFKPHPSRPGTLWSYCKPCVREIDRERYQRKTSTLEGAMADLEKRYERKKRQRTAERRERRQFVLHAIELLRRRGFTKAEIARLADTSLSSMWAWETKPERKITPAMERRFGVLLRETGHLPLGEPAFRRRLPHPEFEVIYQRVHRKVVAIPVRNAWKNGRRAA